MEIRHAVSPEEIRRCVDFHLHSFKGNPRWISVARDERSLLLGGGSVASADCQVQTFWVEHESVLKATATAVIHGPFNRHWQSKIGHLIFFEAMPESNEFVEALGQQIFNWFRVRGCESVRVSYLYGWQLPLTIDAYEEVPTFLHTTNPLYYHRYLKNLGFCTEKGAVEYRIQFSPQLAHYYEDILRKSKNSEIALRNWNFESLSEETKLYARLFNETFASHWGAVPLREIEAQEFIADIEDWLLPEFTVFAEAGGEAIGFVYGLPDLNQAPDRPAQFHKISTLDSDSSRLDHGILLAIGVREGFQGRGVGLRLGACSFLGMIRRGFKSASYTLVLDDNWASRRLAERLGGRVSRNFVVYRKNL